MASDEVEYFVSVEEDIVTSVFMFAERYAAYRDDGEWVPVTIDQEDPGDTADDFVSVDESFVEAFDDAEDNGAVLINPEVYQS